MWQYGLFDQSDLCTVSGEVVQLENRGFHNHNSGPDFLNARLTIGEQEWAGNVEIHYFSSDWKAHAHDTDEAYDNVVLHVVMVHDKEVTNKRGGAIPTLVLKDRLFTKDLDRYKSLIENRHWIPCGDQLSQVDSMVKRQMMDRAIIERLETKSATVLEFLNRYNGDWNKTLFTMLGMSFGGKVNAEPFALLTQITPLDVIAKHKDDIHILEALFIGQAGFLEEDFEEEYPKELQQQYEFLRHKYKIHPMKKVAWRNSRVRPTSLPLLRLAQFARVWQESNSLFSIFLEANPNTLTKLFSISLGGYWLRHYAFDSLSAERYKNIGAATVNSIIINTVVPVLFAYSLHVADLNSRERALSLLGALPAEENAVLRNWADQGVQARNALDSQALLQMKKHHCDKKHCLQCPVGVKLLRSSSEKSI